VKELKDLEVQDKMVLNTTVPYLYDKEYSLKKDTEGHVHSATIDKNGNGHTSPGPDGHIHPIVTSTILTAGDDESSHFHKIIFEDYMGGGKSAKKKKKS
jgi:hypothetical protein